MENLTNVLRRIYSTNCFSSTLNILSQIKIPKMNNDIILLLRNVVRINNKDLEQFDGLIITVTIIQQSLNYNYVNDDWSEIGENFGCLIIAVFDSILLYHNTKYIKDVAFCNLVLETGKSLLPTVDKIDYLRMLVNSGCSSILQLICLEELDFLTRKEIFLLFKPIIVKSDTRQRKTIMNSNELFLSKMATMIMKCGDYETQEAIVEVLMRFSYTSKQKLNKLLLWFKDYPNVLIATRLLDYKNFDISCRKFLNSVNSTINSEDKVLTLPCVDAYANDIKLQKPKSESYEELWVDFSLKTGIIHIICDSGTNAWLRLLIDSTNVRKSLFSSRIFQKNGSQVNGKQILLELISPLEIELHFKENLIVTVNMTFAESSKLEYLQKMFFEKWYQHLNKNEKSNQFEAVSKAFRESVNKKNKPHGKFFPGASVSSISSVHSCSTGTVQQGCSKRGHRFPVSKCNTLSFSTSTPKVKSQSSQDLQAPESSPQNYTFGSIHSGNFWSSCNTLIGQKTAPSISGGIFKHENKLESQNLGSKTSLVKGITRSDDKEEDGLFKKMIEELKKDKSKLENSSRNVSSNESIFSRNRSFINLEGPKNPNLTPSYSNSLKLKGKPLKTEISNSKMASINREESRGYRSYVNNDNCTDQKDCSEESTFTLATNNNPTRDRTGKPEAIQMHDSSSSQVGTNSDETPSKSTRKQLNLLNFKKKTGNSMSLKRKLTFETLDVNAGKDNGTQGENKFEGPHKTPKKQVIHSPYFKLFNLNNSSSSIHSDRVTADSTEKQVNCNTSSFKLKPSILNINYIENNQQSTTTAPNNFSLLHPMKMNLFSNVSSETAHTLHDKSKESFVGDKIESNRDEPGISNEDKLTKKKLNREGINKNKRKRKGVGKQDNLINGKERQKKTDNLIGTEDVDKNIFKEFRNKKENANSNSSNNISKQINKEWTEVFDECKNDKGTTSNNDSIIISQRNNSFCSEKKSMETNPLDKSDPKCITNLLPSTSSFNGTSNSRNFVNRIKNNKEGKTKPSKKQRISNRSTSTQENSSLGPNSTSTSLQSYHIAIPEKTYSTKPVNIKPIGTPDKIFDCLKRHTTKYGTENKKSEAIKPLSGRKRKLYTPNSSLEETSPYKPGRDLQPPEDISKENPLSNANKRKSKCNSKAVARQTKKEKVSTKSKPSADIYDFTEEEDSVINKVIEEDKLNRRKSLRTRAIKRYKELSSDESVDVKQTEAGKKKTVTKQKTEPVINVLTLPSAKLSVAEKVSKFVMSMKDSREEINELREDDLESEMQLSDAPVAEDKSDLSQLEAVEPPVWLSAGVTEVPSPPRSVESAADISLTAPTELKFEVVNKETNTEMDFLQSVIKNIECLTLSIKRKPPKMNSQEKLVKTVETFTNSSKEEMKEKWEEAKKSLQLMLSNLDHWSDSCMSFMVSFEKRMKDMIESSVSEFNTDRNYRNKRSEDICKELKKLCREWHKSLKKH